METNKDETLLRVVTDFVIQPRKLNRDVLDGTISREEYHVCVWLRGSSNPYAVTVVTLQGINQDVFGGRYTTNYINRILLSLKSKKYLYYKPRQGRRGSFEIKMADFLLPTKKITTYEGLSKEKLVRSGNSSKEDIVSEVPVDLFESNQKSNDIKSIKKQILSSISIESSFRSNNNDNHNNNYKDNNRSKTKPILVDTFTPKTDEEDFCKQTAYQLGEQDMRFLLSMKDKYGVNTIEQAYEETYSYLQNNKVDNLPALFNSIIGKIINSNFTDKTEN